MYRINPSQPQSTSVGSGQTGDVLTGTRNFYELQPGERFKALIIDIKPNQVTIRLDDGGVFTARTRVLPDARIGEESLFAVRENNLKGQILLEMVKLDPEVKQGNMLRDALRNAGMVPTDENMALGKTLLTENIPVDAATLQRAAFFRYSEEDANLAKVVFLLKEQMPVATESIQTLDAVLDDPALLHRSLTGLINEILAVDDPLLKTDLLDALLPDKSEIPSLKTESLKIPFPKTTDAPKVPSPELPAASVDNVAAIRSALRKRLFLPLTGGRIKTLNHYYQELLDIAAKTAQTLKQHETGGGVAERLSATRDIIKFMAQVNYHREYYQIPMMTDPQQTRPGELFIFKDGKNGKDLATQASVLIALDTLSLGRVEVYVQKEARRARFQFRGQSDDTLRLISGQSSRLKQALEAKGITVAGLTYQKIEKAFNLLSPEPGADDHAPKPDTTPKRFTFDMRV